ncbi:MAG: SRPBCC family protein [Ardenticatenales bacterium]|nr:SRPBCC family protein [Ardenticatenales bacterium]
MHSPRSVEHTFTVGAPLASVAAFHRDTAVLPRLTPPPVRVRLGAIEPLAEGSVSEFTLWFGPIPVRWRAVHTDVDPLHGFTDTQASGPMRYWRHTHRFEAQGPSATRVTEHIAYAHHPGMRGLASRALFNRVALRLLLRYRAFVMRRALTGAAAPYQPALGR